MERLTVKNWRNLDPWECCDQDDYCNRECYEEGGCINGCIVPKNYAHLARYEDTGLNSEQIVSILKISESLIRDEIECDKTFIHISHLKQVLREAELLAIK